jgi:hypothetical protein
MPNYCECDLYVSGPKDRLEEFIRAAAGKESFLDFDRLIPYPEEFRELDRLAEEWGKKATTERTGPRPADGSNQGGYDWCIEHWGTKWNAFGVRVDLEPVQDGEADACVKIAFITPWSPPAPVIEHAAKRFSDLSFDLYSFECGAGFSGKFACRDGRVTCDKMRPYYGSRGG